MNRSIRRRDFLKRSAAAAGAAAGTSLFGVPTLLAQPEANAKLGVAVVGAGGMGGYSVDCALNENLVAIADVDENTIAGVISGKVKDRAKPKIFHDYRKMFDECQRDIDVVLIATPDHHHAPAAIRAIRLGKHVFAAGAW